MASRAEHSFSTRSKIDAVKAARRRLASALLLFALALCLPTGLLMRHVSKRFEAEALYEYQRESGDIAVRAARRIDELLRPEELRAFEEYEIQTADEPNSPSDAAPIGTSRLEQSSGLPGLIGYFQIDPGGAVHSPLLPESVVNDTRFADFLGSEEGRRRQLLVSRVKSILERVELPRSVSHVEFNRSVRGPSGGGALMASPFQAVVVPSPPTIILFRAVVRTTAPGGEPTKQYWETIPVQRYLQGVVVERHAFFESVLHSSFSRGALLPGMRGQLMQGREVLERFAGARDEAEEKAKYVLHRGLLSPAFPGVELWLTLHRVPVGQGWPAVIEIALVLAVVLIAGMLVIFRLGVSHLELAQQRSDFVSAVTHELKSPLTSIRMYAEMLRSGWAPDEQKRQKYYEYILNEGERLSRLIENILDVVRLNRRQADAELKEYGLQDIFERLRGSAASQCEAAGFTLTVEAPPCTGAADAESRVQVDLDGLLRIVVNLVDNALKFSKEKPRKEVVLGWRILDPDSKQERLCFFVRDYGPGIACEQREKVFELFYRGENELTRATPGTGIGLSIVRELCQRMGADVRIVDPGEGLEVQILFGEREPQP